MILRWISGLAAGMALVTGAAAQNEPVDDMTPSQQPSIVQNGAAAEDDDAEPNPDESADLLNSQQQLQQTFTLQRTINGEVVESDKRTITFSREQPYRETEAGQTVSEALKARFDSELLTRQEAFEEAKLDFTIADANRDGVMSADEFASLVASWRENDVRQQPPQQEEASREQRFEAFLAEISPETAARQQNTHAIQKFSFMAGASEAISREDYIREYLLDFDTMDADKDTLLRNEELIRFRAVIRGERVDM